MNLLEKASISNDSTKNKKKSIPDFMRIDVFIIIAVFILIASPFVIRFIIRINAEINKVNLFISPEFEEILGAQMTENLLAEFRERHPDMGIKVQEDTGRAADILIFDDGGYEKDLQHITPLVSFMDVLFYNIDILSGAGFDRPPKTEDDYRAYAKAAADAGFYSDELEQNGKQTDNKKKEDFAQGKAAMIIASTRYIPYFRQIMGDEVFGLTVIPGKDDINLSGIYSGIAAECEQVDAAMLFVEFLAEKIPVFCEMFKAVPGVVSDIIPGDYIVDDPFYSKAWDIFEYNNRLTGLAAESE